MIDFETSVTNEICQLCERGIEEDEIKVRIRRIDNILCSLCEDCMKDDNHKEIVKMNKEEDFFGQEVEHKETLETPGTEDS